MNIQEAKANWAADSQFLESRGFIAPEAKMYATDEVKRNFDIAMDAVPAITTTANGGIPAFLTTFIDPSVTEIIFAPTKAAKIFDEAKRGTWLDDTVMFPVVEHTGEVSSYGDYATSGRAGVNTAFPQRQNYLFQTIKEYGERKVEQSGLAKIDYVTQVDRAAAAAMARFQNFSYFFGIAGLQNYGLLNDPSLAASLTPTAKTAGNGNVWMYQSAPNATANEVFADIQKLFYALVTALQGNIDTDAKMVLALDAGRDAALDITNSFGISVRDLIKKTYPNMRIETAPQYAAQSASNPEGVAAGNLVQLIADEVEGVDVGFCAFSEKMRAHAVVRAESSWRQKVTGGTWGAVIRLPAAIVSMVGI